LGLAFTGGYENTDGVFLNPENTTDNFGLWNLGIEADVLQGLFVNERRIALDQARAFKNLAENEQQIMINDLIFNASEAYLMWQQYEFYEVVLTENVTIANVYYQNTKSSYVNGEKTAMDTLEAFILYQDAITSLQKNEVDLIKARQNVENFLWFNEIPVTLKEETRPEEYNRQIFSAPVVFENINLVNHPVISSYMNKLSYIEIGQRLKREKLKPKLKLKYNPLLSTSNSSISPNFSINDYKVGFEFSMPMLFRSARADVQRGEVKIQETMLDIDNKTNELQNKIEGSWQQQQAYREQVALIERNVDGYRRLLEGETEKFNYGESSVFLLNKRQEKYIDGQLKLIEVYIKQQMEVLKYLYFSNQLINV
jgi:outer membrane protein TolC